MTLATAHDYLQAADGYHMDGCYDEALDAYEAAVMILSRDEITTIRCYSHRAQCRLDMGLPAVQDVALAVANISDWFASGRSRGGVATTRF